MPYKPQTSPGSASWESFVDIALNMNLEPIFLNNGLVISDEIRLIFIYDTVGLAPVV